MERRGTRTNGERLEGTERKQVVRTDVMAWRGTGWHGEGRCDMERDGTACGGTGQDGWGGGSPQFETGGSSPFHQVPLRSFRSLSVPSGPTSFHLAFLRLFWSGSYPFHLVPLRFTRFLSVPSNLSPCRSVPLNPVQSLSILSRSSPSHPIRHSPTLSYLPRNDFLGKYRQIPRFS